jgi:hypothetical protein
MSSQAPMVGVVGGHKSSVDGRVTLLKPPWVDTAHKYIYSHKSFAMSLKPTGTPPHSTQTDADVIVELYSPPRGKSSDREECLGLKRPSQWNFLDFLSFSWMNR